MKKKYKILIIICIFIILFAICSILFIYREPKISVLCYHNIATIEEKQNFPDELTWTIDVNNFEEQIKYLFENNYKSLTLEELYEWKQGNIELPFKSVLITFDDGFLSNYEYAFPILKKYNMNATVFIVGEYIENGKEKWSGNLTDYMSLDIIERSKTEYPNIQFASHSYSMHYHNSINKKSEEEISKDIINFKNNILETEYYCYPFGAYNNKMIEVLEKNNVKLGFIFGPTSKEYRKASRVDNNYEIPRLNVSYGMDIKKFALRLLMPF